MGSLDKSLVWGVVLVCGFFLSGCFGSCSGTKKFGCPPDTVACGNGCRPASDTVCCDDGTRYTSAYCTNSAGGGCFVNDRDCQAGFPLGTAAEFCCASNGTFGSNDCPAGQRHCGLECRDVEVPCCDPKVEGACVSFNTTAGCPAQDNLCAYCPNLVLCRYCPDGHCCSGDTCAGPEAGACIQSEVCTGLGGGGGGGGSACGSGRCSGNEVCVSTRNCIRSSMSNTCECAGSSEGTCADFLANGIDVTSCGTCSASYSACCPGQVCVNGSCQASCP